MRDRAASVDGIGGQGTMRTVLIRIVALLVLSMMPTAWASLAMSSMGRLNASASAEPAGTVGVASGGATSAESPEIRVSVKQESEENYATIGKWVHQVVEWILSWPFLVLVVVLYLLRSSKAPARLKELLTPFDSFSLFGNQFVMSKEGGEKASAAIQRIRDEIKSELDRQSIYFDLEAKHKELIDATIANSLTNFPALDVRSTIYILDRLFDETLYQLLNYYPGPKRGQGRTYSSRYGIIGRAWRRKDSDYAPTVPTDDRKLIEEWGMTETEAKKAGKERQSFGCIAIRSSDSEKDGPVALIYLDSKQQNAFGDEKAWGDLEKKVQEKAEALGLTARLANIHSFTVTKGPQISIRKD